MGDLGWSARSADEGGGTPEMSSHYQKCIELSKSRLEVQFHILPRIMNTDSNTTHCLCKGYSDRWYLITESPKWNYPVYPISQEMLFILDRLYKCSKITTSVECSHGQQYP